jgi:hypothetical protein
MAQKGQIGVNWTTLLLMKLKASSQSDLRGVSGVCGESYMRTTWARAHKGVLIGSEAKDKRRVWIVSQIFDWATELILVPFNGLGNTEKGACWIWNALWHLVGDPLWEGLTGENPAWGRGGVKGWAWEDECD